MRISYDGIGHQAVTVPAGKCVEGQVCKLNASGQADACAAGDKFCGVVEFVKGDSAAVQIEGFAQVSYTGTAPTVGYCSLSANGSGGVKVDSAGREYLVAQVHSSDLSAVIKL